MKPLFFISLGKVSVKRGLGVGVSLFLSFLFFNPNADFSRFASVVHHCYIFAYKRNEMRWSSFVRHITANNPRHISVKTVEYRSCTNFFSSSGPISAMEVHNLVEKLRYPLWSNKDLAYKNKSQKLTVGHRWQYSMQLYSGGHWFRVGELTTLYYSKKRNEAKHTSRDYISLNEQIRELEFAGTVTMNAPAAFHNRVRLSKLPSF